MTARCWDLRSDGALDGLSQAVTTVIHLSLVDYRRGRREFSYLNT